MNYTKQCELLQIPFWRNKEFKEFFHVGDNKAGEFKKEVRNYCIQNNIRLFNYNKIPTDIIIQYFNINVEFIYQMAALDKNL